MTAPGTACAREGCGHRAEWHDKLLLRCVVPGCSCPVYLAPTRDADDPGNHMEWCGIATGPDCTCGLTARLLSRHQSMRRPPTPAYLAPTPTAEAEVERLHRRIKGIRQGWADTINERDAARAEVKALGERIALAILANCIAMNHYNGDHVLSCNICFVAARIARKTT